MEPLKLTDEDVEMVKVEFTTLNYVFDNEPGQALWQFNGTISLGDGESGEDIRIGDMAVYRLLPQVAYDARQSLFDVLDSVNASVAQYCELLEDDGSELREDVRDTYDVIGDALLILDRMEIEPAYRGNRIGLVAARHAIELSDSGSLVAMKPFPLQFSGWESEGWRQEHPSLGEKDFRKAQGKLRRYWERLGARRYQDTDFYCLSTAEVIPTVEELLLPRKPPRKAPATSAITRARHRHGAK